MYRLFPSWIWKVFGFSTIVQTNILKFDVVHWHIITKLWLMTMFEVMNENFGGLGACTNRPYGEVDNIETRFSSTLLQGFNRHQLGFC